MRKLVTATVAFVLAGSTFSMGSSRASTTLDGQCLGTAVPVEFGCANCTAFTVPSISDAACDGDCAWAVAGTITCTLEQVQTTVPFQDSGVLHCNNEHRVQVPCQSGGNIRTIVFRCTPSGC
ncbi:MAG TPA: hypothetical protein VJP77_01890 [Planctomycetota bacterium]|nr:hypothetical protein [Planctomycetota bacterium]